MLKKSHLRDQGTVLAELRILSTPTEASICIPTENASGTWTTKTLNDEKTPGRVVERDGWNTLCMNEMSVIPNTILYMSTMVWDVKSF